MAIVFHRGLAIPVWAVAFCAVALAAPPRVMPSLVALLALMVIASTMTAMIRWRRTCRPLAPVPATGSHSPRQQEADTIDLVRMDDDGWQRRSR